MIKTNFYSRILLRSCRRRSRSRCIGSQRKSGSLCELGHIAQKFLWKFSGEGIHYLLITLYKVVLIYFLNCELFRIDRLSSAGYSDGWLHEWVHIPQFGSSHENMYHCKWSKRMPRKVDRLELWQKWQISRHFSYPHLWFYLKPNSYSMYWLVTIRWNI